MLSKLLPTFVALLLAATPAGASAAEDEPAAASGRPWAEGVPQAQQDQALGLFEEGNKLFEDSQHAAALAKYREALKAWDHPGIRYNAAVALIHLDQPLGAYENLELALRYGEAPFAADTYQQALTYRKLLRGQLTELKVACAERGAEVTLDGQTLFVAPGEAARWLLPGAHQLVARKAGFLTATRSLALVAGQRSQEALALQEIRSLPVKTARRWAVWKPWAVVGAGALVALAGWPLMRAARSNFDEYDALITGCAKDAVTVGCLTLPPAAADARDRGRVENVAAISLFAVGGAMAASGLAMAFFNQPRVVPADERTHAQVAPLVGPGVFGLALALSR